MLLSQFNSNDYLTVLTLLLTLVNNKSKIKTIFGHLYYRLSIINQLTS